MSAGGIGEAVADVYGYRVHVVAGGLVNGGVDCASAFTQVPTS
jgi:hypothetical protein